MSRAPLPSKSPGTEQISDYFSSMDSYAAAVQSNFSGAGAPSDVVAYETYADTTTNLMMQRNSANTGSFVCGSAFSEPVIGYLISGSIPVNAYGKLVLVDCGSSDITITLPPVSTATVGWWCTIKRYDRDPTGQGPLNNVIIDAYSSEIIEGIIGSLTLECESEYVTLRVGIGRWYIVSQSPVRENLAINGAFDYNPEWVTLASNSDANNYAGGIWSIDNDTMTFSSEIITNSTSNSVYTPKNRLSVTYTPVSSKNFGIFQFFDDLWRFSGKTITVSFEADFKESLSNALSIHCFQHFGAGGSADVDGTNFNINISSGMRKYYKTFTVPTIIGKTIATPNLVNPASDKDDNPWLTIGFTLSDSFSGEFEIQKIKIEESSFPTRWVQKSLAKEIFDMSYYYHNTYPIGVLPGTGSAGHIVGYSMPNNQCHFGIDFPRKMRRNPRVVTYTDTGLKYYVNRDNGDEYHIINNDVTQSRFNLCFSDNTSISSGWNMECNAEFDARI